MAEPVEIYADTMSRLSVNQDGAVTKLFFTSMRINQAGTVEEVPVLILTMPSRGASDMVNHIVSAVKVAQQKTTESKN